MPCEMKSKIIGTEKWSCMQMSATRSLNLQARLIPPVLQAIGPLFSAMGQPDEVQVAAINQAFSAVANAIKPAEFAALIQELCEEAMKDGKRVEFESTFSGGKSVMLAYQVAWFVLEANLGDFFAELLPAGVHARAQEAIMKRMTGPGAVAA